MRIAYDAAYNQEYSVRLSSHMQYIFVEPDSVLLCCHYSAWVVINYNR